MTDTEILSDGTDVEELENQAAGTYVNVPGNLGQVAGTVLGDMNQMTIVRKVIGLREAHELGREYVRRIRDTYVGRSFMAGQQRLDFPQVVDRLREQHHVTLIGEPGTGRRTAAIAVLGDLGVPLEEIPGWDPGQPGQFTVADLPAEPGTGYLFVHPDTEIAAAQLGHELRSYEEKLSRIGSFLVFVATATAWQAIGGSWSPEALNVSSPDRRELLEVSVRARSPRRDPYSLLSAPRIVGLIASAPPRDVVRLGDLVATVADDPRWDLESDLDTVIAEVVSGYQEWTHDITAWLKAHTAAEERLFLLAAAVLESSPATMILRYAEELHESLHEAQPGRHSITSPGARELADMVGADLTGPQERLYFRRPAYAGAVMDYFLSDRSDAFREAVSEWLARSPKVSRQREAAEVADLAAATVLSVVRRRGDISFAIPIVKAWAAPRVLRPVLVSLLTAMALSNETGAQTRARLNYWAVKSRAWSLWEVVADVCSGDLADTYPRLALTRINNLVLRAEGPFVSVVLDAVLRLWERPAMRRDLMAHVWAWLGDPSVPSFVVGSEVLAALGSDTIRVAYDQRFAAEPPPSAAIANVLRSPDKPERLRDTLYGWLDLAVEDESFADWLVDVIAAAIPGPDSALRIACVRTFAYGWESQSFGSRRSALRERLVDRVSDADTTIRGWTMAVQQRGGQDEQPA